MSLTTTSNHTTPSSTDLRFKESSAMSEVLRALAVAQKIVVNSHSNPDPDAYASSMALAHGLKKLGKAVECVNQSGVIPQLAYLPLIASIVQRPTLSNPDLVVVTDCAALTALGRPLSEVCPGQTPVMNLDHHHLSNKGYGTYNLISSDISCSSELAFVVLRDLGVGFDPDLATLLLAGIYHDTLSLQKLITSPSTYHVVAELMRLGGSLERFVDQMYRDHSPALLRLKGELLSTLSPVCGGRYLPIVVNERHLAAHNLTEPDLAPLKNLPLDVTGVIVGAFIRSSGGLCKVSLRSKGNFNTQAIAEIFGGQGHKNASGFSFYGDVKELLPRLESAIEAALASN